MSGSKTYKTQMCEIFCRKCKSYQPGGHLCYIQQDIRVPKLDDTLFVLYDLETRQDVQNLLGEYEHIPVLLFFWPKLTSKILIFKESKTLDTRIFFFNKQKQNNYFDWKSPDSASGEK